MIVALAIAGAATIAYGWFEAGWVRLVVRELHVDGLPPALDGLRVAVLSDFHLGVPSRGAHAVARAVNWAAERRPDIVCIAGDLLSRPRGQAALLAHLERLGEPFVILGNHDHALSRDPFSRPAALGRLEHGTLLVDSAVELELRGARIEVAGVDPRSWLGKRRSGFGPSDADFHLLLCHFPSVLDRVEDGRWNLIVAGHLHGGQIVLPYGFGKLLLAHPRSKYREGVYRRGRTTMFVSAGLGTTFVPFRFFARPEATELVLRSA